MVTNLDFSWLKKFNDSFHLEQYPNITLGIEKSYFLFEFFNLSSFPSLFAYNKNGRLIAEYRSHVDFKRLASELKKAN